MKTMQALALFLAQFAGDNFADAGTENAANRRMLGI